MSTDCPPPKSRDPGLFVQACRAGKMSGAPLLVDWRQSLGTLRQDNLPANPGEAADIAASVDFSSLNAVFQDFLEVTGLPIAVIDLQGRVLASSRWQRLCMEFHRVHRLTLAGCLKSDTELASRLQEGSDCAIYQCANGLTDCATPIVIDGRHVANLFTGQFLLAAPDTDFFRQQQALCGFDGEAYFQALAEIPIVAQGKIPAILKLLRGLAQQIAEQRLAHAKLQAEIARRVQAEAELAQAKEAAERANRAKSAFLANMSHEIRTPLHVIIGLGHLLRCHLSDPMQRQRLDELCANSDHLLALINDILDLSKIEADRLVLDRSNFALGALLERVRDTIAGPARDKGLELVSDITPGLAEAELLGDPLRLAQVLINLGSNAVKFTDRGSVRVAIDGGPSAAGDRLALRFSVADTGIGIAPADQERLFQPFTQGDSSPSRGRGGTGLGLAISQRLIKLMGGSIELESRPGLGSRFSFAIELPAARPLPQTTAATTTDLRGRRILLAEDHPLAQVVMLDMLGGLGCHVDVASDGAEALERSKVQAYDLILMDMQMPKMDGLAATRAIRGLPERAGTPIIALTANAFVEDRDSCLAAGMNDHLCKPVTPAALATALGRWLAPEQSLTVQ